MGAGIYINIACMLLPDQWVPPNLKTRQPLFCILKCINTQHKLTPCLLRAAVHPLRLSARRGKAAWVTVRKSKCHCRFKVISDWRLLHQLALLACMPMSSLHYRPYPLPANLLHFQPTSPFPCLCCPLFTFLTFPLGRKHWGAQINLFEGVQLKCVPSFYTKYNWDKISANRCESQRLCMASIWGDWGEALEAWKHRLSNKIYNVL